VQKLARIVLSMQDGLKILLIDDDQGVLRALGLLLKAMRYDVTPFASPLEAIDYVTGGAQIDLVLTDLRMPVLSGEEVVCEVKRLNAELPVIVMSGHAATEDIALLRAKGADTFIPKPFTPDQLNSALDSLANRKGKAA